MVGLWGLFLLLSSFAAKARSWPSGVDPGHGCLQKPACGQIPGYLSWDEW